MIKRTKKMFFVAVLSTSIAMMAIVGCSGDEGDDNDETKPEQITNGTIQMEPTAAAKSDLMKKRYKQAP